MKGSCFYPFGEVINCDNDVAFSSESARKRSYDIDANLPKWNRVFLDWFQWCFSFSMLILLASSACMDIMDNVVLHSRPIEELRCMVIGVVLTLVACEVMIMNLVECLG